MLTVPLSDAVSEPRAVVVIGGDALFAHSAVPSPQGHVDEALRAVPKGNLYLARAITALDRG
jgi:hypothetical protein